MLIPLWVCRSVYCSILSHSSLFYQIAVGEIMNTKDQLEAFDAKQKEERLAFIEKLKTELNKHLPVPRIEIFQCKVARSGFDYSKSPKFVWKCVLVGPQGVRRLISAEEDDSPWNETTTYKRALEWSETAGWPVVNREYCPEENEV